MKDRGSILGDVWVSRSRILAIGVFSAFLLILLPSSASALCCKCYTGTRETANSFCANGTTVVTSCSRLVQDAAPFIAIRSSSPDLVADVTCDETTLTETTCQEIGASGSSASAVCRRVVALTEEGVRGALQSTAPASNSTDGGEAAASEPPFTSITPRLGVEIPGFSFSPATKSDDAINVPFLAEYINAIYKYLIGIVLLTAIVMVVYGGFRYLIGSAMDDISKGKTIIRDALIGMILVIAAYTILNTVNPATTELKTLRIINIKEDPLVVAEAGVDFDSGETGGGVGSPGPATAEDCGRLVQLVRDNEIAVRAANDRAGLLSGASIRRNQCAWCYNGANRRGTDDDPCFDDPSGGPRVNPKVCKLLVDLYDAKVRGQVSGLISVQCIICGHTRAAQGREDTPSGRVRCETTKRNIMSGNTGPGSGQSNHWTGLGLDLSPNQSIQRYIAETLFPAYGSGVIDDVIGPHFWEASTVACPSNAEERRGSAQSPYLCKNGRCSATWDANALCGHRDHIHVGFYAP